MKLQIEINIEELLAKSKDIDLALILEKFNDLKSGKDVKLLNGNLILRKA